MIFRSQLSCTASYFWYIWSGGSWYASHWMFGLNYLPLFVKRTRKYSIHSLCRQSSQHYHRDEPHHIGQSVCPYTSLSSHPQSNPDCDNEYFIFHWRVQPQIQKVTVGKVEHDWLEPNWIYQSSVIPWGMVHYG